MTHLNFKFVYVGNDLSSDNKVTPNEHNLAAENCYLLAGIRCYSHCRTWLESQHMYARKWLCLHVLVAADYTYVLVDISTERGKGSSVERADQRLMFNEFESRCDIATSNSKRI